MSKRLTSIAAIFFSITALGFPAALAQENDVLGTWRLVEAIIDTGEEQILPYGPDPKGLLVFTADMHFVEVLNDPRVPAFEANARNEGTPEENAAAMAGAIGFYGTYTVDEDGSFTGNVVEGATFPNWIGDSRTTEDLKLWVEGDEMRETFIRPSGMKITIVWHRVEIE